VVATSLAFHGEDFAMTLAPAASSPGPHTFDSAATLAAYVRQRGSCLVVLIGLPGSGKSHLAAALANAPSQILSSDDLRRLVSDDPTNQDATQAAFAAMHFLADLRLAGRHTTIIDATNVEATARAPLLALAAKHKLPALAIVVDAPLEVCAARNARRPGPVGTARWGRRVPDAALDAMHGHLQAALPTLPFEGFAHVLRYRPQA
jgi:predicted kinase